MRIIDFFFTLFSLLFFLSSFAQFPCGTIPGKGQIEELRQFYSGTAFKQPADDTFYIPVKAHIIRKSDGTGGLSLQKFQAEFDSVNQLYKNARIQFELCGQINYIDNSIYRTLNMPEEEDLLTQSAEVARVINIYFSDTVLLNGKRICGYSFLPPGPNNIFIDNACVNNGNTVAHELGHFFSLLHTHGESNTELTDELVNGSNCAVSGDYTCDTPADPNLDGKVSYNTLTKKCTYTGTAKDANGEYFKPMVENIMSYSKPQCTDSFTLGQYQKIRNSLFYHGRIDLVCTSENDVINENKINTVYPNPFQEYFFVNYQLTGDSKVMLALSDMVGRQISVLHDQTEPRGFLRLYYPWSNTDLSPGVYFLKMEVNGKIVSTQKLVRMEQ